MGLISTIKGWWNRLFKSEVKNEFSVSEITSQKIQDAIQRWMRIYDGRPDWVDKEEGIKTINFAKTVTSETARLACLDLSIKLDGSARADYLQTVVDDMFDNIREYVEHACAYGTVVLKPNGSGIECLCPERFFVTETDGNNNICGIVFFDYHNTPDKFYTKMEFHRFVESEYYVSNRCYMSHSKGALGKRIDITKTPWKNLAEDVCIENLEKPLYSILKTPMANHIDKGSPLGISIFAEAIEELKDLDIAYSRNVEEIKDSRRMVLLDSRMTQLPAIKDGEGNTIRRNMKLPKYVKNVMSESPDDFYQEVNPQLNTEMRITGINNILSILAYKCGYSNGYFTFDAMQGIQTATGVEATQQRTIQFIKDIRDKLKMSMDALIYAVDKYADLYDLAPLGEYEIAYGFRDITHNREENLIVMRSDAISGIIPKWMYVMEYYSLTESEAKKLVEEAEVKGKLFDEE